MFPGIIKTELRFASSNLEVRDFFCDPSYDVEYNLRKVCTACTTCAANPVNLARTDEEASWVIQSIVIIVRLLLLDKWFTMIMKLTQFFFFKNRRLSDQILFELSVHMIIIEIKRKSRPTKWMTDSSEHAATDESTRYQVMFRIFLRWVWSLLWNWRG